MVFGSAFLARAFCFLDKHDLKEVVLLKESVLHRLYEVTRAPSIDSLIAETDLDEDERGRAETEFARAR